MGHVYEIIPGIIENAILLAGLLALTSPVLVLLILVTFHVLTAPKVGRFGLRYLFVLVTAEAVACLAFSIVLVLIFGA